MNPALVKFCGAILIALALVGVGYWWGNDAATNRDQAQDLVAERGAAKALAAANVSVRGTEQKSILDMNTASTIYQKGSSDVIKNQKTVMADVRSGAVRLSIATSADPAGAPGPAGAGASGPDDPPRSQLSDTAADFLTGLASEADVIALQLTACQSLLAIDRAAINQDRKDAGE